MTSDDFKSAGDALAGAKERNAEYMATGQARIEAHYVYRAFREKYPQVDDEGMQRHISLFRRLVEEADICAPCLSLDRCRNWINGHKTKLQVTEDGYIYELVTPCKNNPKGRLPH